jgi:hypothetical protein
MPTAHITVGLLFIILGKVHFIISIDRVEVQLCSFFKLSVKWEWMVNATPRHAPANLPSGTRPDTHFTEGCVALGAGHDGRGKSYPHRGSTTETSNPQRVAIPTELFRAPTRYEIIVVTLDDFHKLYADRSGRAV